MSSRRQAAARRRSKQDRSGSPIQGEPEFLLIGKIHRPHGIKGEVLMSVLTDFPERIQPGIVVLMGEEYEPVTIKHIRHHNRGLIIALKEYPAREDVEHLNNRGVFVRAADRPPLPEGEYYLHELIGMAVVTDEGQDLGVLADMIETGANNVYVVRPEEGKDILLPAIDDVILAVDTKKRVIKVHLLEGLLPE